MNTFAIVNDIIISEDKDYNIVKRKVSVEEINKTINDTPLYKVSNNIWICTFYVNYVVIENRLIHINFVNPYRITVDSNDMSNLEREELIRIFNSRGILINTNEQWEIQSLDTTHWITVSKIIVNDEKKSPFCIRIETSERCFTMSLYDFFWYNIRGMIRKKRE